VPTLIGRLGDPGESLENRCRAAKALAEINTHTSVEGLMALVNDEEEEPAIREYIAVLMEKQGLG
jgi:HEAT repeat protein